MQLQRGEVGFRILPDLGVDQAAKPECEKPVPNGRFVLASAVAYSIRDKLRIHPSPESAIWRGYRALPAVLRQPAEANTAWRTASSAIFPRSFGHNPPVTPLSREHPKGMSDTGNMRGMDVCLFLRYRRGHLVAGRSNAPHEPDVSPATPHLRWNAAILPSRSRPADRRPAARRRRKRAGNRLRNRQKPCVGGPAASRRAIFRPRCFDRNADVRDISHFAARPGGSNSRRARRRNGV